MDQKSLLGIFDQECLICEFYCKNVLKNYSHISNQHPQICQVANFHEKTKLPKFPTKNVLLGIYEIEFCETVVVLEINSLKFV